MSESGQSTLTKNHDDQLKNIFNECDVDVSEQIRELQVSYQLELSELPHINDFIERLKTIIRRQQKKLNKIYSKLNNHRLRPIVSYCDVGVQTESDINPKVKEGNSSMIDECTENAWGCGEDIAEAVKSVAEDALTRSGFVYEPTSGMYYDYKTGYYYNSELRMYYDGNSGRYLSYDEMTGQYSYYDDSVNQKNSNVLHKKRTNKSRGKKRGRVETDKEGSEQEEGELTGSDDESYRHCIARTQNTTSANEPSPPTEVASAWPPCLRLMVMSSSAPGVRVGRLFVVTCKGGAIGREGSPLVLLPESAVSKVHLRFSFDGEKYQIVDVGSRNGTWLNGKRLTPALQESELIEITHGDELRIGSTTLAIHMHSGTDTCGKCEPGLQQQVAEQTAPLPVSLSHRAAMRSLKKRFGVAKATAPSDGNYKDRAEHRRSAIGSSHPAEKTEIACLEQAIPKKNKGFEMLAKMGWSEGKSLGKNEQGMAEPVGLVSNVGKTGLGAEAVVIDTTNAAKRKLRMLKLTQERYNKPPELSDS